MSYPERVTITHNKVQEKDENKKSITDEKRMLIIQEYLDGFSKNSLLRKDNITKTKTIPNWLRVFLIITEIDNQIQFITNPNTHLSFPQYTLYYTKKTGVFLIEYTCLFPVSLQLLTQNRPYHWDKFRGADFYLQTALSGADVDFAEF